MYVEIALLLSILAVTNADGSWHQFMKKYANVKILSDCFGEDYMSTWYRNYTAASDFCKSQNAESYVKDLPLNEISYDPLSLKNDNPLLHHQDSSFPFQLYDLPPVGAIPQIGSPGLLDMNEFLNTLQGNFTHPLLLVPLPYPILQQLSHINQGGYYYRKKRDNHEPIFDEKKIQEVYQKIQSNTGNFTCVVKKLNLFNAAFDVDVTEIMSHYLNLNLDADLRNDISEGILDCIKFASCKPLNKMTLTPPIVQRAMSFLKCEAKQRVASCVKSDVRKTQHKFDIQALGKVKAGSDVDEGDKMVAILWGEFSKY